MKSQTSLSICIAVYNHEKYIKQCLDSLYALEYHPQIEWVIVNDHSSDGTDQVIREWIAHHPRQRITYLTNTENLGQVKTLSKALAHADGVYISFMDSDDVLIKSSFQEKMASFKQNPQLKVYYANGVFLRNDQQGSYGFHDYLKPILSQSVSKISDYLRSHTPLLSLSCALFRKDFFESIGGFDDSGLSNDRVSNIKIFQKIKEKAEFAIDYTPVFAYRIHNNNISKNPDLQFQLLSHVIQKYCLPSAQQKLYQQAYFVSLIRYKMINQTTRAKDYLKLLFQNRKAGGHLAFLGLGVFVIPSAILQWIEPLIWDIKQFFKGKLF